MASLIPVESSSSSHNDDVKSSSGTRSHFHALNITKIQVKQTLQIGYGLNTT
jgi:hypothetical protein